MTTRRATALSFLLIALWLAQAAGAQTTTSSSTTSTSSTSSSTSSTVATTSTTQPNPCAGQPCTDRPPQAFIAGANGEVRLDAGGYCWRGVTPNLEGNIVGICTSVSFVDPPVTLVVRRGETLRLRFDAPGAPTRITLREHDVPAPLPAGNPVRFAADYSVGFHTLDVSTLWLQGDASYRVRIEVRAAPGPIALTG